jgi:hypothetical protein
VVLPQGIEECLVDCSTHKLLGKLIVGQHIAYRVRLSLVPKLVPGFDPIGDHKWCGFASIDNDIGIVRSGDRSDALSELASKKVIPRLESMVLRCQVTKNISSNEYVVSSILAVFTSSFMPF